MQDDLHSGFKTIPAWYWLFCWSLLVTTSTADILECFSCQNSHNVSECHLTTNCAQNEICHTEAVLSGAHVAYNLGCRAVSECSGNAKNSMVGRSMASRALSMECNQCCSSSYCNKKLCTDNQMPTCHDDPQYNCALVAASFDICSDVNHAKMVCRKHCNLCHIVDGSWAAWSPWSICDQQCGQGLQLRMRTCTNPPPAHGGINCPGENMETTNCTHGPCPVNGGWSAWAAWSFCDRSCDQGQKLRLRLCNSPAPAYGGKNCVGDNMDVSNCTIKACPVDGGWSPWGGWSNCDTTCGQSQKIRLRSCTSPIPAHGGMDCQGMSMDVADCSNVALHCPVDGGWSSWSAFDSCSATCGAGLHKRNRNCSNPIPKYNGKPCFGSSVDYEVCVKMACADGGWSQWSDWSNCSNPCDGGLMSRTRNCNNPHASTYGKQCNGSSMVYIACNRMDCPEEKVYFTVDTPTHTAQLLPDQLVFTNVVTNEGNGYNISAGEFICKIPGIYHIELSASGSNSSSTTQCHVFHNTTDVIKLHTASGTTTASSAYLDIGFGDYLRVFCTGAMSLLDPLGSNVFSGALVLKQ